MKNNSRESYLDWEFKLSLCEKRIFTWKLERGINQGKKLGGVKEVEGLGQSKEKKRLGMLLEEPKKDLEWVKCSDRMGKMP